MTTEVTEISLLDAIEIVSDILDHDIDPDNSYAVEQFLRKRLPKEKLTEKSIAWFVTKARERRDWNSLHDLFAIIKESVKAWPAEPEADLVENIAQLLATDMPRLSEKHTVYWDANIHVEMATRLAALLLIEQAAWRRHNDELEASYQEYQASEENAEANNG